MVVIINPNIAVVGDDVVDNHISGPWIVQVYPTCGISINGVIVDNIVIRAGGSTSLIDFDAVAICGIVNEVVMDDIAVSVYENILLVVIIYFVISNLSSVTMQVNSEAVTCICVVMNDVILDEERFGTGGLDTNTCIAFVAVDLAVLDGQRVCICLELDATSVVIVNPAIINAGCLIEIPSSAEPYTEQFRIVT